MTIRDVPDDYNELLAKHYRLAYYRATLFISDPFLAEDATQDAMISAWRHRDQFDPERGDFRAWLLTIVRHCCFALLEKERRRSKLAPMVSLERQIDACETEAEPGWLEDKRYTQDKLAESHHVNEAMRNAMSKMRDYECDAFVLHHLYGYGPKEIAKYSGVPQSTINSRTRRARLKLAAALAE